MNAPSLHIETVGAGEPLVLLHGWGLHGGLFSPLYAPLLNRFTLHNVDLPGHGYSSACEPYDLPTLVGCLNGATAHIAGPMSVLGWSFGGMLAQAWALAHPDRCKRLILLCTKPKFIQSPQWPLGTPPAVLQSFVDDFSEKPDETMLRFLTLNVVGTDGAREVLTRMRAIALGRAPVQRVALTQGLEILRTFDVRERLHEITQPTLVITGGLDRLTHPDVGAFYASKLPTAQVFHVPRAAHAPQLSHTLPVAQAIRTFADEH
jgi:pimeloyl-[acyl-carrier protein] methyl ester esterase